MTPIDLPVRADQRMTVSLYYSSDVWNRTDIRQTHVASADTTDHLGGSGWQLHMGKVLNPNGAGSSEFNPDSPLLILPDGTSKRFYNSDSGGFISADRWKYANTGFNLWEATGTDGTVYEFSGNGSAAGSYLHDQNGIAQCTRITDVHGNDINITYTGAGLIDKVTDEHGRTVEFTYVGGADRIQYMRLKNGSITLAEREFRYGNSAQLTFVHSFGTRTAYALEEIVPPEGDSWFFSYVPASSNIGDGKHMLSGITLPSGGTLDYSWDPVFFEVGCQSSIDVPRLALDQEPWAAETSPRVFTTTPTRIPGPMVR